MSIGRYVSDLEFGDQLEPVRYTMTPFIVREYCHGMDEFAEEFHSDLATGVQYAPPTLTHIDKIRLYKKNCPGGAGPDARIHYRFHTRHHRPIPVGAQLEVQGEISSREERRGRIYLEMAIRVVDVDSGDLVTEAWDTAILSYKTN